MAAPPSAPNPDSILGAQRAPFAPPLSLKWAGFANQLRRSSQWRASPAALCKFIRAGGGAMQMFPCGWSRQRAARGSRERTGTGPAPGPDGGGAAPGRAGSAAAPGTRGPAGGDLPRRRSRCPGACPGRRDGVPCAGGPRSCPDPPVGKTGAAAEPMAGIGLREGKNGQRSPSPVPRRDPSVPAAPQRPPRRCARAGGGGPRLVRGAVRCGRNGALRAALSTAEPRPPPRRLGMAGYKKPVVCAALRPVIFTRVCAQRNAWV